MSFLQLLPGAFLLCCAPLLASAVTYSTAHNTVIYDITRSSFTTIATSIIAYPQSGDNAIIRPSAGERVTAGSTYTIKWKSPVGPRVDMELWGRSARIYGAVDETCEQWIINQDCGVMGYGFRNTGEFVWKVGDFKSPYSSEREVRLRLWISDFTGVDMDKDESFPFITFSSNFTIVKIDNWDETTTTTLSTRARTTTSALPAASITVATTAQETDTEKDSPPTTAAPSKSKTLDSSSEDSPSETTTVLPETSTLDTSDATTFDSPEWTKIVSAHSELTTTGPEHSELVDSTTSLSTEFITLAPSSAPIPSRPAAPFSSTSTTSQSSANVADASYYARHAILAVLCLAIFWLY